MRWTVRFSNKAGKQYLKMPESIQAAMDALAMDLQLNGPVRGNWKNYGKLSSTQHHCHVKKGKPTYVACWEVIDKTNRTVEVYYVGTHEGAPY